MAIYLASPMVSTISKEDSVYCDEKWARNKQIADQLRAAGLDIFLPQENQCATQTLTLENELRTIREGEGLIALLSDTRGLYLEAGYAKGLSKPIYAIKVEETRAVSEWLNGFFDYVAEDVDELISYLNKLD